MSAQRLRLDEASLRLDSMPATGRDVVVRPDAEQRAAIAADLNLTAVDALDVSLHAVKFRGGFRVSGRLRATIVQPSVVSLELVTQHIEEPIDRVFLPSGEKEFAGPAGAEVFVDLEGEDLPDHFEGNEADLSDLIIESLALAVDLYPRLPGESAEDLGIKDEEPPENPFAALAALKTDKNSK
jgi:uncharacterized metal-binding protein YceD (DUF177 family)